MTSDYAASRCLLILGHFPGLVLGAQAIEKILKSYLLFHNPELKVRGLGHSLPNILQKAATIFPQMDLRRFLPLVNRFKEHYQARYPDNPDASSSMTTGELIELDAIMIFLNENLPIPRNARYRTGFYAAVTFSLGYGRTMSPNETWLKERNNSLTPLLPIITKNYHVVMADLYPT